MNADQERVLSLFEQASALPRERRAGFLAAACGGNDALRREVESLLAAQDDAGDFLGAITVDPAVTATAPPPATVAVGTRIGRYRLDNLLGEGGFGSVYHARQEEPVRRDVALKIIRPGMDSRQVIARFEAERQALAILDHPHIARVYDAGTTENGRPYFVMEYVPGKPITQFCDENRLSITERLLLFTQACDAISHAHTKAIIHRDVKASNVLAFMHDGKPTVKVIDFGIAKALRGDRLTDGSFNTEQGAVIGTYDSMSPEQADGSPDIDTRTDVYSLGVLLYELLSGAKPFDHETLAKAADHEIRRIIREVEPPRPSTRLSSLGEAGTKIAQVRQSKQDALAKQLRSELEWIPLKAMRKERSRRYDSTQQIAEDIQNYLGGKPLRAGPESRTYRVRKLLARHRAGVAVAAAMSAFVFFGVAFYIHRIREEEQKTQAALAEARNQAEVAQAVSDFLTERVFVGARPENMPDKTIRDVIVTAMLDPAAGSAADDFKDKPRTEAAVRNGLALTYEAVGRVDLALPHAQIALALRRRVLGDDHSNTLISMGSLARLLHAQDHLSEAEALFRETLERRRRTLGDDHRDTLTSINEMGSLYQAQGKLDRAEPLLREALERSRRVLGNDHQDTFAAINNMATLYQDQGRLDLAEPLYREALERYRRRLGDNHPHTLTAINNMGFILQSQGKLEQAEPFYREALERRRSLLGNEHADTLSSISNLGYLYLGQGKLDRSEPLLREALEGRRRVLGAEHENTLISLSNMAKLLQAQHKLNEAELMLRDALERFRRGLGDDHQRTLMAMNNLADVLREQGKLNAAEPLFREALGKAKANSNVGPDHPVTKRIAASYARCLDSLLRHDQASALRKEFGLSEPATRRAP